MLGTWTQDERRVLAERIRAEETAFGIYLDAWDEGKLRRDIPLAVGMTPEVLQKLGAKQLPLVIRSEILKKILYPEGVEGGKHGIAMEVLKKLPGQMHNPVLIIDTEKNRGTRFAIVTDLMDKRDNRLVVFLQFDAAIGSYDVHQITSVYGLGDGWIEKQIKKDGFLRYYDKDRSQEWQRFIGYVVASKKVHIQGPNQIIFTDADIVKPLWEGEEGDVSLVQKAPDRGIIKQYAEEDITEAKEPSNNYKTFVEEIERSLGRRLPEDWSSEVRVRDVSADALERIAGAFGKNITFFRTNAAQDFYINGAVTDRLPQQIFLNIDSSEPHLFVLGHELLHKLKMDSPKLYDKFLSHIEEEIKQFPKYKEWKTGELKTVGISKPPSSPLLKEELIADFTGEQFLNKDFWIKLNQKEPSLFQKVIDIAKGLIDKVLSMFGKDQNIISSRYFRDVKKIQTLLADTMAEYAKRQGDTSLQIGREATDDQLRREFDDTVRQHIGSMDRYERSDDWRVAPNGKPSNLNKRQWVMARTPRFKAWFGDWEKVRQYRDVEAMKPIEITSPEISKDQAAKIYYGLDSVTNKKNMKKIIFVNSIFGKLAGHKEHALIFRTIPQFKEIITNAEPGYFEAERRPERNNVFGVNNYISKAEIDGKEYYIRFSVQEVKKPDGNELHNVFVSDIEIIKAELEKRLPGISTPMTTPKSSPVDYKLTQWLKEVKQAYRSSSKVIGSNGEPLVVYHGTFGEFSKYDIKKQGTNTFSTLEGMGFFFTDSAEEAGGYTDTDSFWGNKRIGGKLIPAYLSIKNPLVYDVYEDTEPSLFIDDNLYIVEQAKLEKRDGVIIQNVDKGWRTFIAFRPAQIKSATGNIGAFSKKEEDIRLQQGPQSLKVSPDQLSAMINKALSILAPGSRIVTKDNIEVTPEQFKAALQKYGKNALDDMDIVIKGLHKPKVSAGHLASYIEFSLSKGDMTTIPHEVFHGVFQTLLDSKEQETVLKRYGNEEKAAEAFAKYWIEHNGGRKTLIPNSIRQAFRKIAEFFEKLRNYLNGLGFQSTEGIFGKALEGEYRQRAEKGVAYGYGHETTGQVSDNQRKDNLSLFAKENEAEIEKAWPEVISVTEGTLTVPVAPIKTSADAAAVFRDISHNPQEALYALFLDAKNHVMSVHIHSKGTIKSAISDHRLIAGKALNEGAASIYLIHNHPSGDSVLSSDDRMAFGRLDNILRETGVSVHDMIAIGRDDFSGINGRGEFSVTGGRTKTVNYVGRRFKTLGGGERISFPADAIEYIKDNSLGSGILFLDTKNIPVGFTPLADPSKIRGQQQADILREAEKRNASGMIFTNPEGVLSSGDVINISKFANATGATLLDAVDKSGSWLTAGMMPGATDTAFLQAEVEKRLRQFGIPAKGEVIGTVVLTNASRGHTLIPESSLIRQLERRYGNEIRELFGIEPRALAAPEAGYLIGFKNTDTLRNRAATARQERNSRLRSKKIRTSKTETSFQIGKRPAKGDIPDISSAFPEVDKRMKAAKGLPSSTFFERMKTHAGRTLHSFTRHFPHLDPKTDGAEIDILRQVEAMQELSKWKATRDLAAITKDMKPNEYELFTRILILDDMVKDIDSGLLKGELPFGYANDAQVRQDLQRYRSIANQSERVRNAEKRRTKYMNDLRVDLVNAGLLSRAVLEDDRYFHHQVLEFMAVRGEQYTGLSHGEVRLQKRGWQRARTGSAKDFNTDYLSSEFEVVSQGIAQLEMKKNLAALKNSANIIDRLKTEAKQKGGTWQDYIPEGYRAWQPERGNRMYKVFSLTERTLDQLLADLNTWNANKDFEELMRENEVHEALALGGKKEQWVIPDRLAKTLDNFNAGKEEGPAGKGSRWLLNKWKQWTLINPFRITKYNINNLSGDYDIFLQRRLTPAPAPVHPRMCGEHAL